MHGLGDRLKSVREALGYAQKGIAEKVGGKLRSWQDYEADNKVPGSQVIAGLAKLGINTNWVLTGEGPMFVKDLRTPITGSSLDQMEKITKDEENQRLQDEQWQQQQEKFKKGLQLMFEMSKDDPSYNPDGVWSALLVELLAMHGLHESGYQRILETLKMLKQRNENKSRDI